MRRKIAFTFFVLGVGGAAACSSQSTGVAVPSSVAIIYGVVRNEALEPVPSANLTVEAFLETCESGDLFASNQVATDSTGYYRLVLAGPHVRQAETCVVVRVPPVDGYDAVAQSGARVRFVHQVDTPPVDSVRVDVVVASH